LRPEVFKERAISLRAIRGEQLAPPTPLSR
jgi:hypothetical protein